MTTTTVEAIDEATIRKVFPDAPADLSVPTDVRSILRRRLADFRRRRGWLIVIWGCALAGSLVGLGLGEYVVSGIVAFITVFGALLFYSFQRQDAADDFIKLYAAARGMSHVEDVDIDPVVPLLWQGDRRTCEHVLSGRIASNDAKLGYFTWTEVSVDSKGNRSETHYHFTVLHLVLPPAVAARYAGVAVSEGGRFNVSNVGSLDDGRKVAFESVEFQRRFRVRVAAAQDDIALYELFSTSFLEQLTNEMSIYWQQVGQDLVFWLPDHSGSAHELDAFCHDASRVLQRYLEEYR